jgi:hypothetical protein
VSATLAKQRKGAAFFTPDRIAQLASPRVALDFTSSAGAGAAASRAGAAGTGHTGAGAGAEAEVHTLRFPPPDDEHDASRFVLGIFSRSS